MRILLLPATLLHSLMLSAQDGPGLDERIDQAFGQATGWFVRLIFYQFEVGGVMIPWVLFPLILGATFFTIYFRAPGIRLFRVAVNTVRGKYERVKQLPADLNIVEGDVPDTIRIESSEGEVNHFQALTAALSATVGLGNIAGVAVAVTVGGPGATFWMILAGLLGMSSKFVECTLGVSFREVDATGKVYGGPMYYLSKGLAQRGMANLGKVLAVVFAVMCVGGSFGGGNMFQVNQAASIFLGRMGMQAGHAGTVFGVIMAVLVGIVIIGGIRRIATVTEKIVPFMAVLYVGAAAIIIYMNAQYVPAAFTAIIQGAFAPVAIAGGFLGVLVQGFRRAAFSNEAGIGSAAIAHSAVKTKHPASEGIVALLEPFIDTVVICTMTALVIVIYNVQGFFPYGAADGAAVFSDGRALTGVDLTTHIFESAIPNFSYVLTVAVVLFAFSTMISWSYYGLQAWTYLFGKSMRSANLYKLLFCVFVVVGAASNMGSVLDFSDAMIFAMMVPNMIGLVILYPVVKDKLTEYLGSIKVKKG
ncbi:MAG: alanine:cation symporter family protein [Flavobacteriales bacterium]|nr:alanine:cation symporter family protein [Flavobacteriales bacterium]